MTEGLDQQIREAIAAIIKAALPSSTVYPWNVLSHKLSDWPGLFPAETREGWVIKSAVQSAERKNAWRDRISLDYDLWPFLKFRTGKAGDNSDDEFAVIRAKAYNAIMAEPRLGFDNDVERHDLLQYRFISTVLCSEKETLHIAPARLTVHLCC